MPGLHHPHVWGWTGGWGFFGEVDDQGAHGHGRASYADGVLDGLFDDPGRVDDAGGFDVDQLFGTVDVKALAAGAG